MTKTSSPRKPLGFSKTARLLKSKDFRFRPFRKFSTAHFRFIFLTEGKGRIGISISKKILRNAAARNRVRRLIRESYRRDRARIGRYDIHVIGLESLTASWKDLGLAEVSKEFERFIEKSKER